MNGAELKQQMIDGGAPVGQVMQWERSERDMMIRGGAPPEEVGKYWGDAPKVDTKVIEDAINSHYDLLDDDQKLKTASSWPEMFQTGLQWSSTGLATGRPDMELPPNADMSFSQKLAAGTGTMLGDLPASIVGGVAGLFAGAAAGTAAAGPPGAAAGAVVGAGAAGSALPVLIKEAMIDYYQQEGGPKTWQDFMSDTARVQWETAKAGLVGAASAGVGAQAGGMALKLTGSKLIGGTTEVAAFTVAAAGMEAGLRGEIPSAEDFMVGAVLGLGVHFAGEYVGSRKRFVPNRRAQELAANLQEVWVKTGVAPREAIHMAQKDPALRAEILAPFDAAGNRVTPTLDAMAVPEAKPHQPYKPPINAKTIEKELAPPVETDSVDVKERYAASVDKIDQLRKATVFLENSAGYAKRHGIPINEVVSPAGAVGEHQIMPATAEQYGYDPMRLTDPAYNKEVATAIIADLNKRYPNDPVSVFIGYNAGPGRANQFIRSGRDFSTLPKETQDYVLRAEAAGLTDTDYNWQITEQGYALQDRATGGYVPQNDFKPPSIGLQDFLNPGPRASQVDVTGRVTPAPDRIAGYLQKFAAALDFEIMVGPGTDTDYGHIGVGGNAPKLMSADLVRNGVSEQTKLRVYIPDTPRDLVSRWYGLGNAEIIYHEVGHAIDKIANHGRKRTTELRDINDPNLQNELDYASKRFRPKMWKDYGPEWAHGRKVSEQMADAYALWLSDPSARKSMPNFTARYGAALEKLADIAAQYLPKKLDGGAWEPPPGTKSEGASSYTPGKKVPDPAGGGGWVPPSVPPKRPGPADDPKQLPDHRVKKDAESLIADILDIKAPEKGLVAPDYFNPKKIMAEFDLELAPARKLDKILEKDNLNPGPDGLTIEDMMRQTLASRERAGYFVRYGTLDPITLDRTSDQNFVSAYKAVKEDGGNLEGFEAYRLAQRTLEKAEQGIDTGVNLESARAFVALASERAKYERGSQVIAAVKDASIDYAVASGRFSPALATAMKALNRYHIVLRRSLEPDYNPPNRRPRTGGPKKIKGSKLQIVDTFTADIDNLHTIIAIADYNRAVGSVIGAIEMHNARVDGVKKIPFYKTGEPAGVMENGRTLDAEFLDANGNPLDMTPEVKHAAAFLAEQRRTAGGLKPDEFMYWREGKLEIWRCEDPDLATMLRQVYPGKVNLFAQAAIRVAGLVRLGVVIAPDFGIRTAITSMMAAPAVGKRVSKVPFKDTIGGLVDAFTKSPEYQDLIAKGGTGTAITDMDVDVLARDVDRVFNATGTGNAAWNVAKHPLDALRTLAHMTDVAARIGMVKRLKREGTDPAKAAMLARKGYIDFAEGFQNRWVQLWSAMTPFMNAGFKDLEQFSDAAKHRTKQLALLGTVYMTVPTILNYAANMMADEDQPEGKRYQDIPRWVRDQYWVMPEINGARIKIRKPWLPAVPFAMIPERFMDWAVTNDPHFSEWLPSMLEVALPPYVPSVVAPILEDYSNRRGNPLLPGAPLIPASLESATGYMQYTPDTSEASKMLTRLLGPDNLDIMDASPLVLDNYVRGWTGTLPFAILKGLGVPFKDPGRPTKIADVPFLGSFFYRMPIGGQVVDDFYNAYDAVVTAKADRRLMMERQDFTELGLNADTVARANAKLGNVRDALSKQRALVKVIQDHPTMTDEEKIKQTDKLGRAMVITSRAGLIALEGFEAGLAKAGK